MHVAGSPPRNYSDAIEEVVVLLETSPGSGVFEQATWLADFWEIQHGENGELPAARIGLRLGFDPRNYAGSNLPADWQVEHDDGAVENAWQAVLTGRQVVIRTWRASGEDDWFLFWGVITRLELGYSGASRTGGRWAICYADSILAISESEPGQVLLGQWRRSRAAQQELIDGGDGDTFTCVLVTAEPPVFNPGGKPNCSDVPLGLSGAGGEDKIYVFTDPGAPDAVPWTVARALRYIEWASMQPPPPSSGELYDTPYTSLQFGPTLLQQQGAWTRFGLRHENLDALLAPLLDRTDEAGGDPLERALLRRLNDVGVDHLSVLEAFALIGHVAGLAYTAIYRPEPVTPQVRLLWTLRGYRDPRAAAAAKAAAGRGGPSGVGGGVEPAGGQGGIPPVARGVWIYVPSDGYAAAGAPIGQVTRDENSTEGSLTLDESATRNAIRVTGDGDQYEVTVELRPGWKPDDWVDVDPSDDAAVAEALARIGTDEFDARYRLDAAAGAARAQYGHVLRRWVLNEHGLYKAADYQRAAGPWSAADPWLAYRWWTEGHVYLLEQRGDDGWSARRRRFLPPKAQWWAEGAKTPTEAGIVIELSFDGGQSWVYTDTQVAIEGDECAIYFRVGDLTSVADPDDAGNDFVRAYIRGRLRVRVTANVEGDDAVVGVAGRRDESPVAFARVSHLSRRGKLARNWRYKPAGGLAANSALIGYGLEGPLNRDDGPEARDLAERLRYETEVRRGNAQVVIPYLLRDGGGPWEGYRPGDEVLGIQTGRAGTLLPLRGSDDPTRPAARITRITWRWRREPADLATTLTIEDAAAEIVGDPQVDDVAALGGGL